MAFNSFNIGNVAEEFVCSVFSEHGFDCELNKQTSELQKYDIAASLDDTRFTIEVKYDIMATRTGNLAVEYHNSRKDKPSGIYATTADIWAVVLSSKGEKELWISGVNALKRFIAENTPYKIIESGGDKNSNMFLYKKDVILPAIFVNAQELTTNEFRKIVYENSNISPPIATNET